MTTLTQKKSLSEVECLRLLGKHCWTMLNSVLDDKLHPIPPKFGRICRHCGKVEYKTMDEMNKEK